MPDYPERDSHFAHRLIRLMIRTCAAQEIGTEGFMLVCIIVHTEDAKHYTAPVTFWNDQLLSVCGFASWGKLDRARKKAKAAGWLHYEEGGKGKVGRYWATVPRAFRDQPDNSAECDYPLRFLSENGEENEGEPRDKRGRNEGEPGDKRGANGEHSTLSLSLSLSPSISSEPQAAAEQVTQWIFPVVGTDAKTWALPQRVYDVLANGYPGLQIETELRKAMAWCETNATKRKTPRGMPKFLNGWLERAQNSSSNGARAGPRPEQSQSGESMAEFVRRAMDDGQ